VSDRELIQGLQYYLGLVTVRVSAVAPSIYGIDFGQIDKLLKENPILQVSPATHVSIAAAAHEG
jgi:hypothetical protein